MKEGERKKEMECLLLHYKLFSPLSSEKMADWCWEEPNLRQHWMILAVSCFTANCMYRCTCTYTHVRGEEVREWG